MTERARELQARWEFRVHHAFDKQEWAKRGVTLDPRLEKRRMTESMIEKLIKASRSYSWSGPEDGERKYHVYEFTGDWLGTTVAIYNTAEEAESFVDQANVRAVLQALREPDEAGALRGLERACFSFYAREKRPVVALSTDDIRLAFTAMIDHILNESDSK